MRLEETSAGRQPGKIFLPDKMRLKGSLSLLYDTAVTPCAAWNSDSHLITVGETKFNKGTMADIKPAP